MSHRPVAAGFLRRLLAGAGATLMLAIAPARAEVSTNHPIPAASPAALLGHPVAASRLGEIRGGYRSSDGRVSIDLGIRHSVYVDGTLVARGQLDELGATPLVVSLGDGNQLAVDVAGAAAIVQNSTSGREIRVAREIDVSVDSLQRVRAAETQRSLVGALVGSLRR